MLKFSFIVFLIILLSSISAQKVKVPRDSIGFCWSSEDVTKVISFLEQTGSEDITLGGPIVAGISPHDDFLYSGETMYKLLNWIKRLPGAAVLK